MMFYIWHSVIIITFLLIAFGLGYTIGLKQKGQYVKRRACFKKLEDLETTFKNLRSGDDIKALICPNGREWVKI